MSSTVPPLGRSSSDAEGDRLRLSEPYRCDQGGSVGSRRLVSIFRSSVSTL
ncbi:hypothetical protein FHR81_000935 [Actinoalloteichus hoggarensis]|uniref:Uncharacterized protein n=1 Tax=Actinoalloteichus hoggarensis TaxID=1470176 RepID=A0A221VYW7_9PSEU|nr:hypothetical protein AHOG_05105 [Actinoalloteichus hoggarensis]MBB5919905.1 hypothetical protein [Actinoalloteichus hoggarensis]